MIAIVGAIALLIPVLQSDTPPLANVDRVSKLSQNFDVLQKQQQQLQQHLNESDRVQVATALIIYTTQRDQAQAQIDAAKKKGERDLAAEALKNNAEAAIMAITSKTPPPAP